MCQHSCFSASTSGKPRVLDIPFVGQTLLQGNDELRGILNAGYGRDTGFVMRVAPQSAECKTLNAEYPQVPTGGSRLVTFSCWCPKVMAAIGRLPDTLADRCIVIRMQRKTLHEECERLRTIEAASLKRRCARLVSEHAKAIAEARPEIPSELNDRAADIWEPLLVLADLAGGDWPKMARVAAVRLSMNSQDNNVISLLLLDIVFLLVREGGDRTFSRTLVEGLNHNSDRPWAEMSRGKQVTELWLAQRLRPYGIRPKTMWKEGVQAKGYLHEDFKEVFQRHIPSSELEAFKRERLHVQGEESDSSAPAQS
jgi:hypothetical protein